ncbi:MAG: RNA-binding protein [Planctomycetes bacterium]|nr:RNA-binding protein [Planctomycetota bacterium]
MANKSLFQSLLGFLMPKADTTNEAGGIAYARTNEQLLAQFAATGCLRDTFYADADKQLKDVLGAAFGADPVFVAKTAVFAREQGLMKDTPALLCAVLAFRDQALLGRVFDRVCDNGKMVRNFVQIVRSGQVGRKSLGTAPKRLVQRWLASRTEAQLLAASVGSSPSLADVVKMVHPKPANAARSAFFGWLLGKSFDAAALPDAVKQLEAFRAGACATVPDVPFQLLTSTKLDRSHWLAIARNASWTTVRMNLNTFLRHGVFDDARATEHVLATLRDRSAIQRGSAFPYQIMTTLKFLDPGVPRAIRAALHDALETSVERVPSLPGKVYVAVDVSGSMQSPVTGRSHGNTTVVKCIDVAALFAAAILRQNPKAELIPFHDDVVRFAAKAKDPVFRTAQRLAQLPSGGTNCGKVLEHLNARGARGDFVIYVSDNESWLGTRGVAGASGMQTEWQRFKVRNRDAKLVCIDIQPYATTQAPEGDDVIHVGGFSDQVFEVLRAVADGGLAPDLWVDRIQKIAV